MFSTHVEESEVQDHISLTFGKHCQLEKIEVFKGGARKQVFLLDLNKPALRCVMYLWHDVHHYFAERDSLDVSQSDLQAPLLFSANTDLFQNLGVDSPKVYGIGRLKTGHYFAFVEYLDAKNLAAFLASVSLQVSGLVLEQTGTMLRKLNNTQRAYPGTILDTPTRGFKLPHEVTLERTLLELNAAAHHHVTVAKHRSHIERRLQTMCAGLKPRTLYHLIHGELGPEHILVKPETNTPCFIDIEGVHFSDLEIEHALLSFRFEQDSVYQKYLWRDGLDEARLAFYRFALHLSLVYAGVKFLVKEFHDQTWARGLLEFNLGKVLESL